MGRAQHEPYSKQNPTIVSPIIQNKNDSDSEKKIEKIEETLELKHDVKLNEDEDEDEDNS